jgi:hypothetical protein
MQNEDPGIDPSGEWALDDRRRSRLRWVSATASVIIPLAVVVLALPYQGGLWLLLALVGGVAASIVLLELAERNNVAPAEPEAEVTHLPRSTS